MSIVRDLLIKKAGLLGSILKYNLRKNKLPIAMTALNTYQRTKDKGVAAGAAARAVSLGGVRIHQLEHAVKGNKFSKQHRPQILNHGNNKIPVI